MYLKRLSVLVLAWGAMTVAQTTEELSCALFLAADQGKAAEVERLLDAGADVNYVEPRYGVTPLIAAVAHGRVDVAKVLLGAGADVNYAEPIFGATPLKLAAAYGCVNVAKMLLGAGADVNYADPKGGTTSLMFAAAHGRVDVAKVLLDAGADVNRMSSAGTSLQFALADCKESLLYPIVRILLSAGADVNLVGEGQESPLMRACMLGDIKVIEILLSAGADVNLVGEGQKSPLMRACRLRDIKVIEMLLEAGADINKRDCKGKSSMMHAFSGASYIFGKGGARKEEQAIYTDIVKLFLDYDANLELVDNEGYTCLDRIFAGGLSVAKVDLVIQLIKAGAEFGSNWSTTELLRSVIRFGHKDLLHNFLRSRSVDINLSHAFAEGTSLWGIQTLLEAGAQVGEWVTKLDPDKQKVLKEYGPVIAKRALLIRKYLDAQAKKIAGYEVHGFPLVLQDIVEKFTRSPIGKATVKANERYLPMSSCTERAMRAAKNVWARMFAGWDFSWYDDIFVGG